MGLFVLEVFLAFCLVSFVSSCSCKDASHLILPDIYYEATYIVKVRIEGREAVSDPSEPFRGEWRYSISTTDKYKVCGEYDAVANKTSLFTPQDSAACGIDAFMDVGSTYIIAGYVSEGDGDGQLRIARCSLLYKPVEEFTYDELLYLEEEYVKGSPVCNGQARGVYPAWVLVVFLMSMAIYQQTSQLVS